MRRIVLPFGFLLIITSFAWSQQAAPGYILIQYTIPQPKEKASQPGNPPSGSGNQQDRPALHVAAAIELKGFSMPTVMTSQGMRRKAIIKHKWGKTNLYNDDQLVSVHIPMPGVATRYHTLHEKLGKDFTHDKEYDLAEFCLNQGLLDEFVTMFDNLAKAGKKTGYDALDRAIDAYTQVKAELAKRIDREDATSYWRTKLGFRLSQSDHYSLLYNAKLSDPPEVERRLKMLERNMKGVYYWFALHGIQLAMPDQKLVAVLLDQPDQFLLQRHLIEEEPLVDDGFFSTRDNVVVFSAQRLDKASQQFSRMMQQFYAQGWEQHDLLQGKGARIGAGKSIDESYRMQTLALLDVAVEEDGEWASVSHDGTRQLFVGAGLQKPAIITPDYLQFGMASVFETPKGIYPLAPVAASVPYWHGWAGESWEYTRIFKLIEQGGLIHDVPSFIRTQGETSGASATLRRVVTNADFNRARDLGPIAGQRELLLARTYAWGLCFFLTKTRPAGVVKLYEELGKMPRDLELEPNAILNCFCRAFDCANTTRTGPDPGKFEELAKDWLGFMKGLSPPGANYNLGGPSQSLPGGAPGQPGGGGGSQGKAGPKGKSKGG